MKSPLWFAWAASLLCLCFLIHELHDWSHTAFAGAVCGCWGTKGFGAWTLCPACQLDPVAQAGIYWSGPLINAWLSGWAFGVLRFSKSPVKKSWGLFLCFACLPLPRLVAALRGGSDETLGLRALLPSLNESHHSWISAAGLGVGVFLYVPALFLAWKQLRKLRGGVLLFIGGLLLPWLADSWIVGTLWGGWLNPKITSAVLSESFPWPVLIWGLACAVGLAFSRRRIGSFLSQAAHQ